MRVASDWLDFMLEGRVGNGGSDFMVFPDFVREEDGIEIPDNWVMGLHRGFTRLAFGREDKWFHLSREGFEANKERLRQAFGNRFIELEREADVFFDRIAMNTLNYRIRQANRIGG